LYPWCQSLSGGGEHSAKKAGEVLATFAGMKHYFSLPRPVKLGWAKLREVAVSWWNERLIA
jgi:hypothetical protein